MTKDEKDLYKIDKSYDNQRPYLLIYFHNDHNNLEMVINKKCLIEENLINGIFYESSFVSMFSKNF